MNSATCKSLTSLVFVRIIDRGGGDFGGVEACRRGGGDASTDAGRDDGEGGWEGTAIGGGEGDASTAIAI